MHKINKNKIVSSSPTLASEEDDNSEVHQEELSMNSGTETDLSEKNQTEARYYEEKPQETPQKNFFEENQNCDEVTVEREDKKEVTTMPEEGLTKEEEHNTINRIIKNHQNPYVASIQKV